MLTPGNGTDYDWGNMNWALARYNETKTLTEFIVKVKLDYPNADPRDYELMWQAFDIFAEQTRTHNVKVRGCGDE
jgi:hypothetical protein